MIFARVSDLRRFVRLSQKPFMLLGLGLCTLVVCVGFGYVVAPLIYTRIHALTLAFGLLIIQTVLILAAGYLLGMPLSVFALGARWRDKYLVPLTRANPKDPEAYLHRVGDRTLPFWTAVIAMCVLATALVQWSGAGYYLYFPSRGYHLVSFRGHSTLGVQRGMKEIVHRNLGQYLPRADLEARTRELLASNNTDIVAQAAWMAGRLQLIAIEPSVRLQMQSPHASVRAQAAIAEGQLSTAGSLEALRSALDTETDAEAYRGVLVGIALSRNSDLGHEVDQRLDTYTGERLQYALWAIGETGNLCAAPDVMTYTDAAQPHEVRCVALDAMKKISTLDQYAALRAVFDGEDSWCELRTWKGRSSSTIKNDFHRVQVSAERVHEKALDAIFNIAPHGLKDNLGHIVNNEDLDILDRKHARFLWEHLDVTDNRRPRTATGCKIAATHRAADPSQGDTP